MKGTLDGLPRGLVYQTGTANYTTDTTGLGPFTSTDLRNQASGGQATWTFTGVAPGTATRIGLDRDLDGTLDGVDGIETYGTSTPGINGPLLLDANRKPSIGTNGFALVGTGAAPGAAGLFAFSSFRASIPVSGITALVDFTDPIVLLLGRRCGQQRDGGDRRRPRQQPAARRRVDLRSARDDRRLESRRDLGVERREGHRSTVGSKREQAFAVSPERSEGRRLSETRRHG